MPCPLLLLLSDTACRVPTCSRLPTVLIRLHRLESAHARHNQSKLCFCSRLLADFTIPFSSYPLPFGQCPRVALGSAPLRGHRMTFGHSSKDPLRPLSQGEKVSGSSPLRGGVIWGHNLYFQRLWEHSKPHPLSSPKLGRGGAKRRRGL